jgi:transcriptional regulator with XRE-family HTH domain
MEHQRHFIREWRKHRGLTQDQLAERVGISRPQLSKIEKGKRKYDQAFLEAAAEELRCDPADLLVRNPLEPGGIWSIWDRVPASQRTLARRALEAFTTDKPTGTDG